MPKNQRWGVEQAPERKKQNLEADSSLEDGWTIGKNRLIAQQPHPMLFKRVNQVTTDRDECFQGYTEALFALIPLEVPWES